MFKLIPRRSLIIYINNNRVIRALRHYGQIDYISRRMHYVVMYVDQSDVEKIKEKISRLRAVKKVELSARPDLDPTLADLELTGVYQLHDEDDKNENCCRRLWGTKAKCCSGNGHSSNN